jgi:amino acid transporter
VEFWIIRAASLAALATVFTESLHDILREVMYPGSRGEMFSFWQQRFVTVLVLAGLALVNVRGVRWGGGLQLFITIIKVASLLGIMILPFVFWSGEPTAAAPAVNGLVPKAFTWAGFGAALLGVLWAYHGWMNIAPLAGEVREPQRNIPIAFLGGVGCIVFLYLGANLAYHLVLPQEEMAGLQGTTVATEFCLRLLGSVGAVIASGAIMCSVFGALNGNLLVGPRLLYAMGADGLAPRSLSVIHPRYHTPALAILVMAGWAMLLVVAAGAVRHYGLPTLEIASWQIDLNPPREKAIFDLLTDFAMFGAVVFETLAVATIFVFRWRLPNAERPYRCPGYPWTPLLYLVLPAYILINMFLSEAARIEALVGAGFIALGAAVYFVFVPRRNE